MKKYLLAVTAIITFVVFEQSCNKDSNSIGKQSVPAGLTDGVSATGNNLDSGLIVYYKFNGNLADSSGLHNRGVLKYGSTGDTGAVTKVTYVPDRFGNSKSAISFGSSTGYIEVPEKDIDGLTSATISMDFFASTFTSGTQVLMSKMSYDINEGAPGFYQSIVNAFITTSDLGFSVRLDGDCDAELGTDWINVTSSKAFKANAWNNEVIEFNDNVERLYLNGILVGTVTKTQSPICSGEPLRLAVWWAQDPQYFTGKMDEFRIYKRVISTADIKALSAL